MTLALPGDPAGTDVQPSAAAGREPLGIVSLLRTPTLIGGVVAFLFFGVLGGWAAIAPLSSGAIATGTVSPDSNRRVIQHLEGGIIRTIHVREGQRVSAGELLITLEPTRAEATYSSRQEQWLRLLVTRARLEAQAQDLEAVVLPDEVVEATGTELQAFVATQLELFDIRRNTVHQEGEIFKRKIEQFQSEIDALTAESRGIATQLVLTKLELADKEKLLDKQLISRSAVLELQRQVASLESASASNEGRIAQARQSIEEIGLSILQAREKYRDDVARESTQVNNDIAQIEEDMVSSGDVLRRTEIVSPVDGTVLNFRNQTTGGVIRPGEPIMDVVPENDDLIVVARLAPKDIDVVHVGLLARVTLLPFATRNTTPLEGEVVQVAADSTLDEASRQHFYEVRVRIGVDELARHDGMYLAPGMPADVTVVTGERTMLQYLVEPFIRSVQLAFVAD